MVWEKGGRKREGGTGRLNIVWKEEGRRREGGENDEKGEKKSIK